MNRNIKAEQARLGMSNQQVADRIGICRKSYENKLVKNSFNLKEIMGLIELFDKPFDYLFATDEAK